MHANVWPQFALELQQQAFRRLLSNAGHLDQPPGFLQGHGLGEFTRVHARQHRQSGAGTDTGNLDQLAKSLALLCVVKAVQNLRVFTHHKMRQQTDPGAQLGQVVKRAHGHMHLVADPVAIHQHLGWIFVAECACQFADHFLPIMGNPFAELST